MTALQDYTARLSHFSRNAKLYLLSSLMGSLAFSIYALFFNLYILSLGYSQALVGILAAVPALVTAAVALPTGYLGDRVGHRRTMILGALLVIVAFLGILLFTGVAALILFTGLYGLGTALELVISAPFMAENSGEDERTHLFSAQFALMMGAGLFGSALGGVLPGLMHRAWGVPFGSPLAYRGTLLVAMLLASLALWPLWRLAPPPAGRLVAALRLRLRTPIGKLARLLLPNILIALGAGLLIPFLNVFFRLLFHISDALLGLLFAGGALATAIATLSVPLLALRLGRVRTIVWSQLASIPFMLLMGFAPQLSWAALGYLLRGVLMPMTAPLYSLFIMEHVAAPERATVNGLSAMGWNIAFGLGAWLSGLIQIRWGFGPLFLATTVIYLLGTLLIQLYFPAIEQGESRSEHALDAAQPQQAGGSVPTLRD